MIFKSMFIQLLTAILVSFLFTVIGHYYLYVRIIFPIFHSNSYFETVFFILWGLTFFGFLILRVVPHFFRKFFEIIMFVWMGVAFILLTVCLITSPISVYLEMNGYSEVFLSYFVIISGSLLTIYAMYLALKSPEVIETKIVIDKEISEALTKLKFVVLSDIHVSGLIGKKRLTGLVKKVNALNPDFIFLTGDLMDGSLQQLGKQIQPLADLKATHDIVYITGNHEYYSGPLAWKKHFSEEFRWKVLSNSSLSFNIDNLNLNIIGVEDKHWLRHKDRGRRHDTRLQTAVEHLYSHTEVNKNSYNILLAHRPKDYKYLVKFPFIQLQISGHTHGGGQLWPFHYIVKRDQKYCKGLHSVNLKQSIYVNQGTGFWGPPMRLGTKCEISLLKFVHQV